MRTIDEIHDDFDLVAEWEAVANMAYSRETKELFDAAVQSISQRYPDYRSALVKKAPKQKLAEDIAVVVLRTRDELMAELALANARDIREQALENQRAIQQDRAKLAKRVRAVEAEYLDHFDYINDAKESFECVIGLIESGHLRERDLPAYGIFLSYV